jgi:redox-sensitive bicupin YhaK (pirin superfamily)
MATIVHAGVAAASAGVTVCAMNTTTEAVRTVPAAAERTVAGLHKSTGFHWVGNGFHVSTYFPSQKLPAERVSPFVLMDYGPAKDFAPLAQGKRGVGWHPHRGFETVTLAWEGSVAHGDNAGNRGVIGPGDVQWMTAASGIFHEEFHEEVFTREGGRMHMMQLWVNLPKKDKMAKPGYQPITAGQIPTVTLRDGNGRGRGRGTVRIIAGEHAGTKGPARTFTPITMLDARLEKGAPLSVELPAHHNAMVVVARGRVTAGGPSGQSASTGELLLFANDGPALALVADEETHLIVLAGEPLNEPIVQYGPFVMNSVEEIQQAIHDIERGGFGPIPV